MARAMWKVQIGRAVLQADSPETTAAIEAQNARRALPGLAPEFNPFVIDPAKWRAFVAAVSPEAAKALGDRPLFLDLGGLRIAASSPTTPSSFGPALRLILEDTVNGAVLGRTEAPYDCDLAETRAEAAKRRTEEADQLVKNLERRQTPSSVEQQVRYAAALAWRENATAAASCRGGDPAAAAKRDAATQATRDFAVMGGSVE